jgi:hypothetical protein
MKKEDAAFVQQVPTWRFAQAFGRNRESEILYKIGEKRTSGLTNPKTGKKRPRTETSSLVILDGAAGSGKSKLIESQPWWNEERWLLVVGEYKEHDPLVLEEERREFRKLVRQDAEYLKHVLP